MTNDLLREKDDVIERLSSENEELKLKLEWLEEQICVLRAAIMGKSSEKIHTPSSDPRQPTLFDAFPLQERPEPFPPASDTAVKEHTRKKRGRKKISEDIPRKDVVHEKSPEELLLPCGCRWEKIGEKVTEQLDFVPAKIQVLRHRRAQYALRPAPESTFCQVHDDLNNEQGPMELAPMPPQIIHQGIVSAGLVAHVVIAKFADAIPLYRQETQFHRWGLDITRGTLCKWVVMAAMACARLVDLLVQEITRGPIINMDETPVQVLNEPGRSNTAKSFMWIARGGSLSSPCILFRYAPTRAAVVPQELLVGFRGFLQTDGYKGYELIGNRDGITHVGCWAHARRKFIEVIKGTKGELKAGVARTVVNFIGELYRIEREARQQELPPNQILEIRLLRSKPITEKLKAFLDEKKAKAPPKSLLGKALTYTLNQWPRLLVFLTDGSVRLDNNLAENAIRPFVVGRKNWLFSGSPQGAVASAILYSLIETAKANGIEPYAYLRMVFSEIPKATTEEEVQSLLPQYLDRSRLHAA